MEDHSELYGLGQQACWGKLLTQSGYYDVDQQLSILSMLKAIGAQRMLRKAAFRWKELKHLNHRIVQD